MKNYRQIHLFKQTKLRKRIKSANRRARKKYNATGKFTKQTVENLYVKQRGRCACCRVLLLGDFHIDHIIALSKGGTNNPDNLQLLKPDCNLLKDDMSMEEYLKMKKESVNV